MMNLPLPTHRLKNVGKGLNPVASPSPAGPELKQLPLAEFLKPMLAAIHQSQPWVEDFHSDQIMLPLDLYEVIKEFSRLQPGNAS